MTLKIGIGTFSGQVASGDQVAADAYADIISLARTAEDAGFDAVWVSSHHGVANGHIPSPLILLAAVAAVTDRIGLGTAVVLAPFQQPLRFAEDCAVLDHVSRGRLMVCLGAGWRDAEFDAFGIAKAERGSRTTELAEICRAAWHQERFSFEGRHHRYHDVAVTPRPGGPPRLFLGGSAPRAVRRAGRLADGFIATGTPHGGLKAMRDQVASFDAAARQAGRDPASLAIGFQANVWVAEDGSVPPVVAQAMWSQIGAHLTWHAGADGGEPPRADEAEIRRRGFLGTPAEVVEQVRPWLEAFPDRELHLLFKLHFPGLDRSVAESTIRLFGAEVNPELRRQHRGPEAALLGEPARHG